ncbi:MAG: orotate phosphoribosyltransferase [Thermoleophilia bacterium]
MAQTQELMKKLGELLVSEAYMEGDFVLTSGKHSDQYFDCKQVTLHPEGLAVLSELLAEKLHDESIPAIGGLAIGADPIVGGVVSASWGFGYPVRGFIVRKEPKQHGTRNWIEGPVEKGQRVAIVDDVVTSGGSIITAVNCARLEGLDPVVAIAIVDREEGGAENIEREGNVPFQPLFRYSELFK